MSATQTKNQRVFIADMNPNDRFSGTFSISNAQLGVTRNGDPYLACLLGDKTGTVPGRKSKSEGAKGSPHSGQVRSRRFQRAYPQVLHSTAGGSRRALGGGYRDSRAR